jgi:hypothetical protein
LSGFASQEGFSSSLHGEFLFLAFLASLVAVSRF